jgi:hypothetical protein
MPRGATHFAATLYNVGHETLTEHGMADYLLAAPDWPDEEGFRHLKRVPLPRPEVEWKERLTVIRDPYRVVATMIANNDYRLCLKLAEQLKGMPESFPTNVDFMMNVALNWYHNCLAWSGGEFFRAETKGDLGIPTDLGQMNPGENRPPTEEIMAALAPATLEYAQALREDFGYE